MESGRKVSELVQSCPWPADAREKDGQGVECVGDRKDFWPRLDARRSRGARHPYYAGRVSWRLG